MRKKLTVFAMSLILPFMLVSQEISPSDSTAHLTICISNEEARYVNEVFAEREFLVLKDANSTQLISVYERAIVNLANDYSASQKALVTKDKEIAKANAKAKIYKKGFLISIGSALAILAGAIIF